MGKMTMGRINGEDTIRTEEPKESVFGQALLRGLREAVEAKEILPTIVEVPYIQIQERIIEVIKEVPVIQYVDRVIEVPVEIIKEIQVIQEKIIEVPVIQIREKEVRVVDIEPLLIEREKVRMAMRSNAILRVVILGLTVLSCILAAV